VLLNRHLSTTVEDLSDDPATGPDIYPERRFMLSARIEIYVGLKCLEFPALPEDNTRGG